MGHVPTINYFFSVLASLICVVEHSLEGTLIIILKACKQQGFFYNKYKILNLGNVLVGSSGELELQILEQFKWESPENIVVFRFSSGKSVIEKDGVFNSFGKYIFSVLYYNISKALFIKAKGLCQYKYLAYKILYSH